jgi:epsilon-lactone hydrolase
LRNAKIEQIGRKLPHTSQDTASREHRLSIRAEIVRLGLRLFIKRMASQKTSVATLRRQLAVMGLLVPPAPRGTAVERVELDGVKVVRIARKLSRSDRHVLYLHGGGHVAGKPALYRDFSWRIAEATRARVLMTDHRLAPEHPYPAALDDAVAAYRGLIGNGAEPRRTVVMGESAGGGLALALLLKLRDQRVPLPAASVLLSPWTDLALTGASMARNAKADPMLKSEEAARLARCYLGAADPRTPYASPLYGDPTGLPPTLFHVGSDEVLLDDSVRMAERMCAAGCEVELEVWPRMPHAWHVWARMMPEARTAIARIGEFVEKKMVS